jgi:plasmid maintenance system antidote protein VapI
VRSRRNGYRTLRLLSTSAQLWMNLQNRYNVEIAAREIGKKLDKIEPIIAHAAA